jgi:RNA polymerase sigma factor (sigma-70 family)
MDTDARPDLGSLLAAAAGGSQSAWNIIVDRHLPLVFSVIRRYRLNNDDAHDVSQTVWLRLVEHLDTIREPSALPGWIVTTTAREALRVVTARGRTVPVDPMTDLDLAKVDGPGTDDELLRAERHQALRDGLAQLKPEERELMTLLIVDPPLPYAEVARRLDMPVGSIGPTRGRCLQKLRATAGLAHLGD